MSKRLRKAIIEVIMFMATMMAYQVTIFGERDLKELGNKINEMLEASFDDK